MYHVITEILKEMILKKGNKEPGDPRYEKGIQESGETKTCVLHVALYN